MSVKTKTSTSLNKKKTEEENKNSSSKKTTSTGSNKITAINKNTIDSALSTAKTSSALNTTKTASKTGTSTSTATKKQTNADKLINKTVQTTASAKTGTGSNSTNKKTVTNADKLVNGTTATKIQTSDNLKNNIVVSNPLSSVNVSNAAKLVAKTGTGAQENTSASLPAASMLQSKASGTGAKNFMDLYNAQYNPAEYRDYTGYTTDFWAKKNYGLNRTNNPMLMSAEQLTHAKSDTESKLQKANEEKAAYDSDKENETKKWQTEAFNKATEEGTYGRLSEYGLPLGEVKGELYPITKDDNIQEATEFWNKRPDDYYEGDKRNEYDRLLYDYLNGAGTYDDHVDSIQTDEDVDELESYMDEMWDKLENGRFFEDYSREQNERIETQGKAWGNFNIDQYESDLQKIDEEMERINFISSMEQNAPQTGRNFSAEDLNSINVSETDMGEKIFDRKVDEIYYYANAEMDEGLSDKQRYNQIQPAMFMMPEQKETFNAYFKNEMYDEAMAYYEGLEPYLRQIYLDVKGEYETGLARSGDVGMAVQKILTDPIASVEGTIGAIGGVLGVKEWQDPNAEIYGMTRTNQNIQTGSVQWFGDKFVDLFGEDARGVGEWVGQTGWSVANNVSRQLLTKGVTKLFGVSMDSNFAKAFDFFLLGSDVMSTNMLQGMVDGQSPTEAFTRALGSAAIEIFTENMWWDDIYGPKDVATSKRRAIDYLKSSFKSEGAEELSGHVLDTVFDELVSNLFNDESEIEKKRNQYISYYMNDEDMSYAEARAAAQRRVMTEWMADAGLAYLSGGVSALVSGGARVGTEYYQTRKSDAKLASDVLSSGIDTAVDSTKEQMAKEATNEFKLIELGEGFKPETLTNKIATKIREDIRKGKEVNKADMGELVRSIVSESSDRVADVSKKMLGNTFQSELKQKGVAEDQIPGVSDALLNVIVDGKTDADTMRVIAEVPQAQEIVREYQMGKFKPQMESIKEQTATERAANKSVMEMLPAVESDGTQDAVRGIVANATVAAEEDIKGAEGERTGNATETISEGKISDIAGLALKSVENASGEGKELRWQATMSDGRTVDLADVQATNADVAQTLQLLQSDGGRVIGENMAQAVLEIATENKTGDMAPALTGAMRIMWAAATEQAIPKVNGISTTVSDKIVNAAKADLEAAEAKRLEGYTELKAGQGTTTLNGVSYGSNAFNAAVNKIIRDNHLSSNIKTEAQTIGTIAKAVGANVELYYDAEDTANQGMFTAGGGIRINLAGTTNKEGAHRSALATFAHEVTHNIEANSPTQYAALRSYVFTNLGSKLNIQSALESIQNSYAHYGESLDLSGAVSELVAKACETVLTDESVIRQLQEQDADLAGTVGDAVNELVDRVQSIKGDALTSASMYARAMGDVSRGLSQAWMGAYREAASATGTTAAGKAQASRTEYEEKVLTRDKDYFDNIITNHPDINITVIDNPSQVKLKGNGSIDVTNVSNTAKQGRYAQTVVFKDKTSRTYAYVPDLSINVELNRDGLVHGFDRNNRQRRNRVENALLTQHIAEILQNAVEVNRGRAHGNKYAAEHVMIAGVRIGKGNNQKDYAVGIVIQNNKEQEPKLVSMDIIGTLNSINEKATSLSGLLGNNPKRPLTKSPTVTLSAFFQAVKNDANDIFSEAVYLNEGKMTRADTPFSRNNMYSISDEAYMDAVQAGDMDEARKILEAYAASKGYTIRAYHGTGRADRVGTVFRADRATSGPMAFFTDSRDIAENYSRDKRDTSINYDEEYDDYYKQFRVKTKNGKTIPVGKLWDTLSFAEQKKITEKAKHITLDDEAEEIIYDENQQYGIGNFTDYERKQHGWNSIDTLIDGWLEGGTLWDREGDFLKVLELAGIKDVIWMNPDYREEKVYDTFLKIQNPFDTDTMYNEQFLKELSAWWEKQDQSKYTKESMGADLWDKNNISVDEWIEHGYWDMENGTTHNWTRIPDGVTAYLQSKKYDGIKDKGGKGGGAGHTVWIPFTSEQIKSAETVTYDNKGKVIPLSERFRTDHKESWKNTDIRYSIQEREETYKALNIEPEIMFTGTMEQIDAAEKAEDDREEEFRKLIDRNEFMALEFVKPDGRREILHASTRPGIRYQLSYIGSDGQPTMHQNYGLLDRKAAGNVNVYSMDELYRHFVNANLRNDITFNVLEDNNEPKSAKTAEKMVRERENINKITEKKANDILKKNGEIAYAPAQYSFAGETANGEYKKDVREAYRMDKEGATDEEIRAKTNCIRGFNGRWWRILDNNDMKLTINIDDIETGEPYKLKYIYDAKELYEAYPLLEGVYVYFDKLEHDIIGQASTRSLISSTITYNTDYLSRGKDGIEATLQHEIQHIIQFYEFSNKGANPTFWADMQNMARARVANNDRQINELYNKYGIDSKNELAWGIEFNEDGTLDEEWLLPEELGKVKQMTQEELDLYKALDKDNQKWVKLLQGNKTPTSLYMDTVGEIEARAAEEKTDENTRIHYPHSAIAREDYTGEVTSKPGASFSEKDDIEHLFGSNRNNSQFSFQDEMDYDVQSWMETVPEWSLKTDAEKTLLKDYKSLRMKLALDRERERDTMAEISRLEDLLGEKSEGTITRPESMVNALEDMGIVVKAQEKGSALLVKDGETVGFLTGNNRVKLTRAADAEAFARAGFDVDLKTKRATYVNPEGVKMGDSSTKRKLEALRIKLKNIQTVQAQTQAKLAEITSDEGFGGMMYRQQQVLNDLMYNKTQSEVQDIVGRMEKRAAEVQKIIDENQKAIDEMEKEGILGKLKQILGTTTAEQSVAELKKTYNSTWTKNEIMPLFNEIVLKMTQGQDYQEDVERMAGILINSSKDNTMLDEDLNALRGMTLIISQGQLKELKGQNSSLDEVRRRLAGTGITVKTGEYSSLTDNLEDTIATYGPALFQDLGDEKDALENFLRRVESRRDAAIMNEQYGARLGDAMGQIAAKAAGVAKGIYMPSDSKAQGQVLALIEFVKGLNAQTQAAQKTLQNIADDMAELQKEGKRASGMAGSLARDVNVALDYYSRINTIAQESARNQRQQAIIEQLKSKQAEKILKINEQWRQLIERDENARQQAEENSKTRGQINTVIKRIYNLLKNPKGTKNISESMQGIARTVLESIVENDLYGRKLTKINRKDLMEAERVLKAWTDRDGAPTLPGTDETSDEFSLAIVNQDIMAIDDGITAYNADINGKNKLDTLQQRGEILTNIQEALSEIETFIKRENQVFVRGKQVQLDNAAYSVLQGTNGKSHREWTGAIGRKIAALRKMIISGNMTPEYYFRTLGNNGLSQLWDNYHDAENRNGLEMARSKEKLAAIADKFGFSSWDMKKRYTVELESGKVQMTLGQIMSLWATWNREMTLGPEMSSHLTEGGFYTEEQDLREGILGKAEVRKRAHRVTEADMSMVAGMLTDEQKDFIDEIVAYLSNDMSKLGNEASMEAYGIKMYKEKYYFPMQMWDGIKSRKSNESAQGANVDRAFHPSFSKTRKHGANNALVIGDFMQTAVDHIAGMINYATMGLANESLQKVLNYTVTEGYDAATSTKRNVRAWLEEAYGQEAMQYLLKLQEQLNGGAVKIEKTLYDKALTIFRKNAVAGSLSVALQQPMSYIRAAMMINPKHLAQAISPKYWKGSYAEMMKYSGVAVIKDMGKFDMNAGQSAREYMMPDEYESKGRKAWNTFEEKVTILPEIMDRMTWTRMWSAVKAEQAAQHPEMDTTSDEFLTMCGERFNDVMRRTQVYESVLVRSANMRNQNQFIKSLTSFMAEPTLTLNVLADAVRMAVNKEAGWKGTLSKAGATFLLSAVLQAAIKGLMGSGRTPDEDKTWEENFLYRFFSNLISEVDPLQMIPGFSDAVTLLKGGELQDDAMGALSKIITAFSKTGDALVGKNSKGWYRDIEDSVGQLAQLFTGVPVKNLMRDGRAMWNWTVEQPYADRETSSTVIANQTADLFWNADNLIGVVNQWLGDAGYKTDAATYKKRVYEAMRDGNEEAAQNYIDYLLTGKGVKSEKAIMTGTKGVTSYIVDDYKAGNITRTKADELLKKANPTSKSTDLAKKLDEVDYESQTGKEVDSYSLYMPLYDAMDEWDQTEIDAQKKHLEEIGVKSSTITSNMKSHVKEQYENGTITRKQAEELYKKIDPKAETKDITKALDEIDYEKETGEDIEGYSLYTRIYDAIGKGDAATIKSQTTYLKSVGIEEKDVKSQIATYITGQYKEGKVKKADAESKLKSYSGMDADEIYWSLDRIDYSKATGKTVSGTYYRLWDAMDANKSTDIQSAVKNMTAHGVEAKNIKTQITKQYKADYLSGNDSQKTKIRDSIQKAYKALGYSEADANKTINKWK